MNDENRDLYAMIIAQDVLEFCDGKKLFRMEGRSDRERNEIVDGMIETVKKSLAGMTLDKPPIKWRRDEQ